MRVGVVGCGDVATRIYLPNSQRFAEFDIVACADLDAGRASELSRASGVPAVAVAELLAQDDVDIVLNLTPPAAHSDVSLQAIEAAKHVYSEKPLAVEPAAAREILRTAEQRSVRVACSPDTFLGAALGTARRLVSEGVLGVPVSAEVVMQHSGAEHLAHPRPQAFYARGGGPLFDMGPYYLTPLVRLFGQVVTVEAMGRITHPTRVVLTGPDQGATFPVTTPSHLAAVLRFESGLLATVTMSFDCAFWTHTFTLNGSDASLRLADPDEFGGPICIRRATDEEWSEVELDPGITDEGRGVGLADFAKAIADERPHRASAAIALHVVEVMTAVLHAALEERAVIVPALDVLGELAGDRPGVDAPFPCVERTAR
jgi:predicted dehydrogenase